ncbi:MAG TPA: 30S ribosomal protein S3 [Acidimicrobiia bacterium]|nr:30S ribosomal protein S3 [Acidimicrobiia bacterium]
MGQKVHPYSFRLGVSTDWKSKWFSKKEYVAFVNEDWRIRKYLTDELLRGAVSRVDIERTRDRLIVDIHTARPGVVIGRKGAEAERLRGALEAMADRPVKLNINEVKDPDLDAALLARGIADQIENRIAFRRAMKRAIASALKAGAEGVRVECKGRLGGAEMGRREWYREGRVPLHTFRADIDYGTATAHTTVGTIGVKVWVYRGEVVSRGQVSGDRIAAEADLAVGGPARRTRKSIKSRAEEAAGSDSRPRLIEAGGGKRLIEAGGGKKEGGRRLIEAGGGRRPTPAEAQVEYESAREEIEVPVGEIAAPETEVEAIAAPETEVEAIEPTDAPPSTEQSSVGPPAEQGDNAPTAPEVEEAAAPEAPEAATEPTEGEEE